MLLQPARRLQRSDSAASTGSTNSASVASANTVSGSAVSRPWLVSALPARKATAASMPSATANKENPAAAKRVVAAVPAAVPLSPRSRHAANVIPQSGRPLKTSATILSINKPALSTSTAVRRPNIQSSKSTATSAGTKASFPPTISEQFEQDDFGFVADASALSSIMNETGIALTDPVLGGKSEEALKKRASIFQGAVRVPQKRGPMMTMTGFKSPAANRHSMYYNSSSMQALTPRRNSVYILSSPTSSKVNALNTPARRTVPKTPTTAASGSRSRLRKLDFEADIESPTASRRLSAADLARLRELEEEERRLEAELDQEVFGFKERHTTPPAPSLSSHSANVIQTLAFVEADVSPARIFEHPSLSVHSSAAIRTRNMVEVDSLASPTQPDPLSKASQAAIAEYETPRQPIHRQPAAPSAVISPVSSAFSAKQTHQNHHAKLRSHHNSIQQRAEQLILQLDQKEPLLMPVSAAFHTASMEPARLSSVELSLRDVVAWKGMPDEIWSSSVARDGVLNPVASFLDNAECIFRPIVETKAPVTLQTRSAALKKFTALVLSE